MEAKKRMSSMKWAGAAQNGLGPRSHIAADPPTHPSNSRPAAFSLGHPYTGRMWESKPTQPSIQTPKCLLHRGVPCWAWGFSQDLALATSPAVALEPKRRATGNRLFLILPCYLELISHMLLLFNSLHEFSQIFVTYVISICRF